MTLVPHCQHVNGKNKNPIELVIGYQLGFEYPWTNDLASEKKWLTYT